MHSPTPTQITSSFQLTTTPLGTNIALAKAMVLFIALGFWLAVSVIFCLALVGMAARPTPTQTAPPVVNTSQANPAASRNLLPEIRLRSQPAKSTLAIS